MGRGSIDEKNQNNFVNFKDVNLSKIGEKIVEKVVFIKKKSEKVFENRGLSLSLNFLHDLGKIKFLVN